MLQGLLKNSSPNIFKHFRLSKFPRIDSPKIAVAATSFKWQGPFSERSGKWIANAWTFRLSHSHLIHQTLRKSVPA
jgi:hypothetical protein